MGFVLLSYEELYKARIILENDETKTKKKDVLYYVYNSSAIMEISFRIFIRKWQDSMLQKKISAEKIRESWNILIRKISLNKFTFKIFKNLFFMSAAWESGQRSFYVYIDL